MRKRRWYCEARHLSGDARLTRNEKQAGHGWVDSLALPMSAACDFRCQRRIHFIFFASVVSTSSQAVNVADWCDESDFGPSHTHLNLTPGSLFVFGQTKQFGRLVTTPWVPSSSTLCWMRCASSTPDSFMSKQIRNTRSRTSTPHRRSTLTPPTRTHHWNNTSGHAQHAHSTRALHARHAHRSQSTHDTCAHTDSGTHIMTHTFTHNSRLQPVLQGRAGVRRQHGPSVAGRLHGRRMM